MNDTYLEEPHILEAVHRDTLPELGSARTVRVQAQGGILEQGREHHGMTVREGNRRRKAGSRRLPEDSRQGMIGRVDSPNLGMLHSSRDLHVLPDIQMELRVLVDNQKEQHEPARGNQTALHEGGTQPAALHVLLRGGIRPREGTLKEDIQQDLHELVDNLQLRDNLLALRAAYLPFQLSDRETKALNQD